MNDNTETQDLELALLNRARRYCAAAEQCSDAVRQKVSAWGGDPPMAGRIIARLRDEGYLDDIRYARRYCESKLLGQHWGRQKVAYQLRMKHLAPEAIAAGMDAVDDEAYMQALADLAAKKARTLPLDDRRRKLTAFLASRGYAISEINQVLINISEP